MELKPEVRQLCDEIRRFIRAEVDPRSREIEESDEVPEELLQKAREVGLFGLTIPEEYGGSGLDLAGKCAVEIEMGKTNYGFATVIGNHTGISTTGIVALGTSEQKKKFLPRMASGEWIGAFALTEPQAGSDPASMRTKALKKSERHYSQLLEQSDRLQEQLRRLSRQILSAQEDERKMISRELHDVIAQTLTGINVRLANLKKEAAVNTKGLDRNIARTQRLVEKSVNIVHQFARELRPAVLDDLGLIPALHSFMKSFSARTGVHTRLTAFAGVEQLDMGQRTVLYRVAQEALTNVGRHAQASRAQVKIQKLDGAICMKIWDNGKGFQAKRLSHGKRYKRLGLLGMSERVEMINGNLAIQSTPGRGTTIQATIPLAQLRV